MKISVIIPVYNDAEHLKICLDAFSGSSRKPDEIIVVDDASTDGSGKLAEQVPGVKVIISEGTPRGPAHGRNRGAEKASGDLLLFLDSDVRIHANTLEKVEESFASQPQISAIFGSYDDSPLHTSLVSRFKNLLHHFVHQTGKQEASTFWSGCGAVRKDVFSEMGGFDEDFLIPSIEDIELGARLTEKGYQIRLIRDVLVTHLKKWTFWGWIKTDIFSRAVPWTRLILMRHSMINDLNLKTSTRFSAFFAWMTFFSLPLMIWELKIGWVGLIGLGGLIGLNLTLWKFFYKKGGLLFLFGSFFLHGLYLLYSSLTFILLWLNSRLSRHIPILLVLIALIKGIVWSLFMPPFFGQDEHEHFMVAQQIARNQSLKVEYSTKIPYEVYWLYRSVQVAHPDPQLKPMDLTDIDALQKNMERLDESWMKTTVIDPGDTVNRVKNFQKIHPPFYYMLCALIQAALERSSILVRILACRGFSILLGCVTVLLAFFTGRMLWPDRRQLALLLAILVGFHPQLNRAYFSVMSNGALETMLFSTFIYISVSIIIRGISIQRSVALGLILGMGLLTKISFVSAVVLTVLLIIADLIKPKEEGIRWRRRLWLLFLPLLIALCTSGWWYAPRLVGQAVKLVNTWGTGIVQNKISFLSFLFGSEGLPVLRTMIERYWGNFYGGGSVFPHLVLLSTVLLTACVLFILIKKMLFIKKGTRAGNRTTLLSISFLGLTSLVLGIFYLYIRYRMYYLHDGIFPLWPRYFLPAVIGQMVWLITGVVIILPVKLSRAGPFYLGTILIIIHFFALFHVIAKRIYGPLSLPHAFNASAYFQPTGPTFIGIFALSWCIASVILVFILWKYCYGRT